MGIETGTAMLISAAVAAAGTAASVYSNNKQARAQRQANAAQEEASNRAYAQQMQDMRRQNQQSADISSLLEQNTSADTGSTMLTGAGGVDPNKLMLGKGSSLLGG